MPDATAHEGNDLDSIDWSCSGDEGGDSRMLVDRGPPAAAAHSLSGCDHRARKDIAVMKLKLDLHDVYNRGGDIRPRTAGDLSTRPCQRPPHGRDHSWEGLRRTQKHVLRFLDQKEIKAQYHRVEKDPKELRTGLRCTSAWK